MELKILKNPNEKEYDEVTQKVTNNDGYCPCMFSKVPDTKCICKEFRDQTSEGFCHCRRFVKKKV
jgi:hypothetical protein